MDNEIIEVKQAEMLQAINRAEVDIQIATAKQYPRDINASLNKIATYAMMDKETAEDCFYVLKRGGSTIEGCARRAQANRTGNCTPNGNGASDIVRNIIRVARRQSSCESNGSSGSI